MHIECINTTESMDFATFYCQTTLQWTKISFATLLSIFYKFFAPDTWNASIIVCIVESWISFVVIPTILDFFHFTTKVASSVSPSQHVVHVDFDMPLSYSLMTYNTCGLLHFEV